MGSKTAESSDLSANNDPKYDALFVFGAVMRWEENIGWHFPLIMEEKEYSGRLVLGRWRAEAAAILQHTAPMILVSGGSDKHPITGKTHSRSVELAREIVSIGVPEEKVFPMGTNNASHTLGNVSNLTDLLRANGSIKKIGMLCPRFQMPRAMVMQYSNPFYMENGIDMTWIEVERTLIEGGHYTKKIIDDIYSSHEADICTKMEQRGLQDFLTGAYKPKN